MRAWVAGAALAAMVGCVPGPTVYVVDAVEDGTVVLVDARGELWTAREDALPPGLGEGDALVDGRRDPAERARLEAQVQALRRRLAAETVEGRDLDLTREGP